MKVTEIIFATVSGMFLSALAMKAFAGGGNASAIVPASEKMKLCGGTFELRPDTCIWVDAPARETGQYLAERLRRGTGYRLPIHSLTEQETKFKVQSPKSKGAQERAGGGTQACPRGIVLTTQQAKTELGAEGYALTVTADGVVIRAPATAGLFYGVQTLLQLLPNEVFAAQPVPGVKWTVPGVEIEDRPRFAWRGFMLDVSRHFFNKEEVEQLLDAMALHKLNMFQWHLTDDQGWRIEIKKYPRLTQVGAWRKSIGFNLDPKASTAYGPDGRYGGYYTQADIREVVAYAQARHITIVPEIEMPGHSSAALAAYPELSCSGGPYSTDMSAGVHAGVYCAGREKTFTFLQNVLAEVCRLFPGPYIHIGGDEVPKENWRNCPRCQARMKQEGLKDEHELQSYFIRRIEGIVRAHGRRLVGWSEIREGGLAQNAVLMDWKGGGLEAASSGHDVVMSPVTHCYLDYYQSRDRTNEPAAIGGYLPLKRVYDFDPVPTKLAPQFRAHILGGQGNVWTEYMPSLKHVEYMAFPRLCALAEAVWSPPSARNWDDFTRRLKTHCRRLERLGINYRKGPP